MTARTLKDLEEAEKALERAHDAAGRSSAKNPNARLASISEAAAEVRAIVRDLKRAGILPSSDHEVLETRLDAAFSGAAGNEVVTHDGRQYTRRSFPLRKNPRGKVVEWGRSWEEVTPAGSTRTTTGGTFAAPVAPPTRTPVRGGPTAVLSAARPVPSRTRA